MWHQNYHDRLSAWVRLREACQSQTLSLCVSSIHQWWRASPWQPYYLHWDDRASWPDPWQLLADNVFCDVARALGMLYTLHLLDRPDCVDVRMLEAEQGNLVLVQGGKYIMNWTSDIIVNIQSIELNIKTVLEPAVLDKLTG